eukprot:gene6795-7012_t
MPTLSSASYPTDSSKYGTHIRKRAPGSAEEKLTDGQQVQLQDGDVVRLAADVEYRGADADAFLKEEQHRLDRLRRADELFHANIKPTRKKP